MMIAPHPCKIPTSLWEIYFLSEQRQLQEDFTFIENNKKMIALLRRALADETCIVSPRKCIVSERRLSARRS
jgi:hypothetical protein